MNAHESSAVHLYRPAPPKPSRRWALAANGLRLLAISAAFGWITSAASSVVFAVGRMWLANGSVAQGARWSLVGRFLALGWIGSTTLTIAGLALFARMPKASGAHRAIYAALAFRVVTALSFVAGLVGARVRSVHAYRSATYLLSTELFDTVVRAAFIWSLFAALERVFRAHTDAAPRGLSALRNYTVVAAFVLPVTRFLEGILMFAPAARFLPIAVAVFWLVVHAVLTLGLVRALRGAADVLRSQTTPD